MPYNLPAATQTRKVNSLPGDLKDIVNELIANKFKVEEEVMPEHRHSYGGTIENRYGEWPSSSYRAESRDVTLDAIYNMLRRVKAETYTTTKRGKMQFVMGRGEFDDIMHDMRSNEVVKFNPIRIFDVDVALVGGRTNRVMLEAWY